MKRFYSPAAGILLAGLLFIACDSEKDKYPKDYVGFKHSTETHVYDKNASEETMTVKIMAVKKKDEDREIKLSINKSPILEDAFKLTETKMIIKAGKKEASTTIKIYPRNVVSGMFIRLTCTPQWKGGEKSQLAIQLTPK
ncbi:hypothetical protein H8744_08880 [Oscillospiraceae bacterium N12]|jgi:hypothetical protein|uniref:Lipoprotein n=1 Tax=Jilunia laotingensis TaxID=2763675 RepID=A0A926IQ17_9BACT|nr:hypothetical protein [Jilunia laotingensis]MBC8593356.1 hypothetical protein [Jilunia laotingensis]